MNFYLLLALKSPETSDSRMHCLDYQDRGRDRPNIEDSVTPLGSVEPSYKPR